MKLNYRKTIFVGFAFFLISAFWQAYDAIVPLILTNHFGLPQTASGAVMSIDNVLAVFLLPLFGAISDKVNTRHGKRTPFIFFGSAAAIISFIVLTLVDNYQIARLVSEGIVDYSPAVDMTEEALEALILEKTLELTAANPWPLIGFIATLLVVLVSMATFRSPAVALMPDVTVKPLRSKGNAIINLMGTAGGISVLVLGMIFGTAGNKYMKYTGYVLAVCSIMILGLIVFLLTVKEKKWAEEMEADTQKYGLDAPSDTSEDNNEKRSLGKAELKSLLLIL